MSFSKPDDYYKFVLGLPDDLFKAYSKGWDPTGRPINENPYYDVVEAIMPQCPQNQGSKGFNYFKDAMNTLFGSSDNPNDVEKALTNLSVQQVIYSTYLNGKIAAFNAFGKVV